MSKSPVPTPHLEAKVGDIAETVLLPGDPLRAKFIAEKYLENYELVSDVRGIPAYTGTVLPFVASIVIGTIQLGATIDYAILITNKYITFRKDGKDKKQAIDEALGTSISSIIVSGLCFFGATFGVGVYSKIEMIGSLCTLMSRGALISMVVVITVLPAFLMIFDKIICKTTMGMKEVKN